MEQEYLLKSVHEEFAKRVEEENDRQNHRLSDLERIALEANGILASVERLATNMEHMAKEQAKQGERLDKLEGKDGEMWRTAITHVLLVVIGGVATYFLTRLGM